MPSEIVSEAEIIENAKRNILEEKRAYLCRHLNPDDHFDFLRSKLIITSNDQETVKNETTRSAKCGKLLDIILTKGPNAYEMLVLSIQRNKTQTFLVEMLNKEFEKKKNAYIALLRNDQHTTEADLAVDPGSLPTPNPRLNTGSIPTPNPRLNTGSIPTPNPRLNKKCVESEDKSITPGLNLNELCLRESYFECPDRSINTPSENCDHDQNCIRHQSDV